MHQVQEGSQLGRGHIQGGALAQGDDTCTLNCIVRCIRNVQLTGKQIDRQKLDFMIIDFSSGVFCVYEDELTDRQTLDL